MFTCANLTNVKLIHVLFPCCMNIFYGSLSGNMLSQLSSIEPLNGGNYGSSQETIKIALALWDIDLTLTHDPPIEHVEHVINDGKSPFCY
jgi:hypothetical protein